MISLNKLERASTRAKSHHVILLEYQASLYMYKNKQNFFPDYMQQIFPCSLCLKKFLKNPTVFLLLFWLFSLSCNLSCFYVGEYGCEDVEVGRGMREGTGHH